MTQAQAAMQSLLCPSSIVGPGSFMSSPIARDSRIPCCGPSLKQTRRHSVSSSYSDSDPSKASPQASTAVPSAITDSSRRGFMIATTSLTAAAAAAMFIVQPDSAQAARKPRATVSDKLVSPDEVKGLSGLDAKLLANQRRKEALKDLLEKQKKKAKSVVPGSGSEDDDSGSSGPSGPEIVGQSPDDN